MIGDADGMPVARVPAGEAKQSRLRTPRSARSWLLPQAQLMRQVECMALLTRTVFDDAVRHGWLVARCTRRTPTGRGTDFYATEDVRAVEERILAGEYPGQGKSEVPGK